EDIAQDAFMRLAAQTGHIEAPDKWLRTVAYRSAIDELRRRDRERRAHHRSARMADRAPVDVPDPLVAEEYRTLGEAMAQLPFMQRAAALLCWGDEVSTAEAAEILGCSVKTIRVHLHRARKALQAHLPDPVGEDER
ncbi:MAG TPA: sigma-70 family RNA polymerase sigma factor, partial [Acidimicrobiales bacterium]